MGAGKIVIALACCIVVRNTAAGSCAIPLEPTRTSFVVTVGAGGEEPSRFLFDTGTSTTVITPEFAARSGALLSGSMTAITTAGTVDVARGQLKDVKVGPIHHTNLPVLVLALPPFPSHGRIDGILGADILAGRGYRVDVRGRCLHLDSEPEGGTQLAAKEIAGRIAISVGSMNFVLDSGASFPVLMSDRARALADWEGTTEMKTAGGSQVVPTGVIHRLRIGGVSLHGAAAVSGPQHDLREDALIPMAIFREVYVAADRRSVIVR